MLEALKAKREELQDSIYELDEAIDALETLVTKGIIISSALSVPAAQTVITQNFIREQPEDYSNMSIYEGAVKILMKKNKVLTTDEIVESLVKAGKKIEGEKPRIVVATTLYKSVRKKKDCKIALAGKGLWKIA
jgi:hypothetical protein